MNGMSNPVVGTPVNLAAPEAAATPTTEPTFTLTESELLAIMSRTPAPAGVSPVTGPRQAAVPQDCMAHRVLSRLERTTSEAIVALRDHVVVPANLYVVDRAKPQMLAAVATGCLVAASGAGRVSAYLARLAQNAAAKSSARKGR